MRIRSLVAVAVLMAAFVLGSASIAFAAPAQWDSVDLVVHDENGKQLVILAGVIPTETALPAEVEIAVPAGLELQWAGEILGGDPGKDPSVAPKITFARCTTAEADWSAAVRSAKSRSFTNSIA